MVVWCCSVLMHHGISRLKSERKNNFCTQGKVSNLNLVLYLGEKLLRQLASLVYWRLCMPGAFGNDLFKRLNGEFQ